MATCSSCGGSGMQGEHTCSACGGLGYFEGGKAADDFIHGRSNKGCLSDETEILCADGWIELHRLQVGQVLQAVSASGDVVDAPLAAMTPPRICRIWEIHSVEMTNPIRTTYGHPFLTTGGWRNTWMLRAGTELWSLGADLVCRTNEVTSVVRSDQFARVRNLVVEGGHSFIVKGAVSAERGLLQVFRPSPIRLGKTVLALT